LNVELGGILGYPNFYSPVIVGPAKKRVVFAVSGNPSSVGSNIQLSLVALSLNNGRLLWTAEEPATSYYGILLCLSIATFSFILVSFYVDKT